MNEEKGKRRGVRGGEEEGGEREGWGGGEDGNKKNLKSS